MLIYFKHFDLLLKDFKIFFLVATFLATWNICFFKYGLRVASMSPSNGDIPYILIKPVKISVNRTFFSTFFPVKTTSAWLKNLSSFTIGVCSFLFCFLFLFIYFFFSCCCYFFFFFSKKKFNSKGKVVFNLLYYWDYQLSVSRA